MTVFEKVSRKSLALDKRMMSAFDEGRNLGEFIVSEHDRFGHSSSFDKLAYVGGRWRSWEIDRHVANDLATLD